MQITVPYSPDRPRQRTICVIGAGPSGLAALKTILDSPEYAAGKWNPTVFEAREDIGGIWFPASSDDTQNPLLSSPLYDSLSTNIPHPVMAYTNFSFPPSTPLFPHASHVKSYLDAYADHYDLRSHIRLNTAVAHVTYKKKPIDPYSPWQVTLSNGAILPFDLVLVCSGFSRMPRYPDAPGLDEWLKSGKAFHAAQYRSPKAHRIDRDDTVLVLGSGYSATDISAEIRSVGRTVIRSTPVSVPELDAVRFRTESDFENLKIRGRTLRFGSEKDGEVTFEDGTTESGITRCILATGYQRAFPFLSDEILRLDSSSSVSVPSPPLPPLPASLHNSTYHIFPLSRHMFPLQTSFPPHTLVFLGLPSIGIPFPLAEAQAQAALHVFTLPTTLDLHQELADVTQRYHRLLARYRGNKGSTNYDDDVNERKCAMMVEKRWHYFEGLEYFDYLGQLETFVRRGSISDENSKVRDLEWKKKFFGNRMRLQKIWVTLEERGEAETWVRGVGEGGPEEWVDLMEKLLSQDSISVC